MDAKAATRQYCQISYTYLRRGLKLFIRFYDISGEVSYLRMPELPEESPSLKHIF